MKKNIENIAVLIVFLCLSLLTGCDNRDKNTSAAEDQSYQYAFEDTGVSPKFYKTAKGYYFTSGKFIYYLDGKTMKYTPVCNKPDCLHDQQTDFYESDQCNAYIRGQESPVTEGIGYYNGYIYYQESVGDSFDRHYVISRLAADGSSKDIIVDDEDIKNTPYRLIVHRGYLYYTKNKYILTDKKDSNGNIIMDNETGVYKIDLDSREMKPELFLSKDEMMRSDGNAIPVPMQIRACGDHILTEIWVQNTVDSDEKGSSTSVNEHYYLSKNISTKAVTDLSKIDPSGNNYYIDDSRLLFFPTNEPDDLYAVDPDGTTPKKVFSRATPSAGTEEYFGLDESYYYLYSYKTVKDEDTGLDLPTGTNILKIYSKDFKLLNTVNIDLNINGEKLRFYDIGFSYGDKLMVYTYVYNNDATFDFFLGYIPKEELLKKDGDLTVRMIMGG